MRLLVVLLCILVVVGSCAPTITNYAGCSSYWARGSFPILVSPDDTFTKDDMIFVEAAAHLWNEKVGEEVFYVQQGALQTDESYAEYEEGVEMSHTLIEEPYLGFCTVVYNGRNTDGKVGRIWRAACLIDKESIMSNIDLDKARARYIMVIVHELGHAVALKHDKDDPTSFMYPQVGTTHFTDQHLDIVRRMMNGTYKKTSPVGITSCF